MRARCTYQTSVKLGHQKCIISAEYQHKPQECDGCLLSLAFGVDTGDKLRDGVHIKQGREGNFLAPVFTLTKLIMLAEHKKKPQEFDGCLLS